MDTARQPAASPRCSPFFLQFRALDGDEAALWTFTFDQDLLTLSNPAGRPVLTLHREEAARYMRFEYDLLRGPTISLVVVEGLKQYTFRCQQAHIEKLLAWLPHLSPEETEKRIRNSGISVALLGLLHVVLSHYFLWIWGVLLAAMGCIGVVRPRKSMYLANAASLFVAGLWALLLGIPSELRPWNVAPETRMLTIAVGAVALMWAVHQLMMLGPNRQLRAARAIRDAHVSFLPERSRLVRRIGWTCLFAGIAFAFYAGVSFALAAPLPAVEANTIRPVPLDAVVFGVLALLNLGAASLMLAGKRPAYVEAKLAGQILIATAVFAAWSCALRYTASWNDGGFMGVFGLDADVLTRPYVWATLMVCVLAFNRWFTRVFDRELEEQRG